MQTILGSGGGIGLPLAKELKSYTEQIRLVGRNPKKVNDTDELIPIDVNDLSQIDRAIAGSEIVYVLIGFETTSPEEGIRNLIENLNKVHDTSATNNSD